MSIGRPIHFISGLPRSGSKLLAAILRQNPALHAGMSNPLASLVMAMQRALSQENEGAPFLDEDKCEAVLRGVVDGFCGALDPDRVVHDTDRVWCAKLPLLARLYPEARVVACVRDVGNVTDSFERVACATPLQPSGIHKFDPGTTAYGRIGAMAAGDGLVGFALDALRKVTHSDFGEVSNKKTCLAARCRDGRVDSVRNAGLVDLVTTWAFRSSTTAAALRAMVQQAAEHTVGRPPVRLLIPCHPSRVSEFAKCAAPLSENRRQPFRAG